MRATSGKTFTSAAAIDRVTKDPVFTMDSCTFKCRGLPSGCTQDYLSSLFGFYGEFVQATLREFEEDESQLNFALVTFRNPQDVNDLLDRCSYLKTQGEG